MSLELEVLDRAERYFLISRLGRGGAGETWQARRETGLLSQEVCIKRPIRPLEPSQRRALLEEARVLASVRHANVVSLLDVAEERSRGVFLVLELVRGLDLKALTAALARRGQSLSPGAVAAVGVRLCRALAAAQRSVRGGLVHRDVTPHNVLVSTEGEVKLADFGVARAFDRERWTRTGLVKGKTAYVSPEQLRGEVLDVRSDLFALGVLLFELLCGRRPFPGRLGGSLLHAIANDERLPLADLAADAPVGLVRVVEQLLAHDRDARPASADVAARLLAPEGAGQAATDELRRALLAASGPGLRRTLPGREAPHVAAVGP